MVVGWNVVSAGEQKDLAGHNPVVTDAIRKLERTVRVAALQADHLDLEGMRFAVGEIRQKGRDVDFWFSKVKGIDSYYGSPEPGCYATGKDDRERPGDAGEHAIDHELDFTEWRVAVQFSGSVEKGVCVGWKDVGVPKFFCGLAAGGEGDDGPRDAGGNYLHCSCIVGGKGEGTGAILR